MTASQSPRASCERAAHLHVARNQRGHDVIVGDVHGTFSKLQAALDAVGFSPDAGDRLFLVGDLVDRGPESIDALAWLAQPWVFSVRGNHDQMAIDHVAGLSDDVRTYIGNGGGWFLALTRAEQHLFADAFAALPIAITLETSDGPLGIVHAECPIDTWAGMLAALDSASTDQVAMCCMWSRGRVECGAGDTVSDVRAVVVGHTPMQTVTSLGNHIFIDTMGWRGREFTLLSAETLQPIRRPLRKKML